LLAATSEDKILLFDPKSGRQASTLSGGGHQTFRLVFDASARLLATTSLGTGSIGLWNPATGEELGAWQRADAGPAALALSPSGRWLAAADFSSGRIHLWDLAEARRQLKEANLDWSIPSYEFRPPPSAGTAAAFLEEGERYHLSARYAEAVASYS